MKYISFFILQNLIDSSLFTHYLTRILVSPHDPPILVFFSSYYRDKSAKYCHDKNNLDQFARTYPVYSIYRLT